MIKKIKKHGGIAFITGLGLFLMITGLVVISGVLSTPKTAEAASSATSSTITVTATVSEYLAISVSSTSVALSPTMINTAGGTNIASSGVIIATTTTNDVLGYTLSIQSTNAGLKSGTNYIYSSTTASSTITAGDDNYGAIATSSVATVELPYDYWLLAGTVVGRIASTTSDNISHEHTPGVGRRTDLRIYAACDALQTSGSYTDTIWITATGQTP